MLWQRSTHRPRACPFHPWRCCKPRQVYSSTSPHACIVEQSVYSEYVLLGLVGSLRELLHNNTPSDTGAISEAVAR